MLFYIISNNIIGALEKVREKLQQRVGVMVHGKRIDMLRFADGIGVLEDGGETDVNFGRNG